jgi:hypothetical protein
MKYEKSQRKEIKNMVPVNLYLYLTEYHAMKTYPVLN